MSLEISNDRPRPRRERQVFLTLVLIAGCALALVAFTSGITLQHGSKNASPIQQIKKNQAPGNKMKSMLRSAQTIKRRNQTATLSLSVGAFDVVWLPINPESTISHDIAKIEHLPAFSRIDLHFKATARCPRPYLLGRLSGPSLALIHDWRWNPVRNVVDNTTKTIMTGLYQVPVSGRYNLEVIVIHCNDQMHNMKQHGVDAKSQPGAMNIDEHLCIEDPYYHRLTEETTKIWVDHTAATLMQPKRDVAQAGYWRRRDDAGVNNDGSQTLLTRFQSTDNHFWETPSNPTSMGEYVYDALLSGIVPKKEDLLLGNGSPQICLLGSRTSHQEPQQLAGRIKSYLRTRVGVNVTLTWSIVESPLHVTKAFAQSLIESQNCRKIVITGVPPWHETNDSDADPTSAVDYWDGVHAIVRKVQAPSHQVGRYRDEVEGMLRTFVNFRSSVPEESGSFDLYLLPLPYRPLDLKMTSCPPLDWRSPPVIDGYNVAMAEACEALGGSQNNVTFLDTRPILDPLWDSVDDWGRSLDPDGTVLTAEANYIANYILDLFKPVERSVVVGIGTRR